MPSTGPGKKTDEKGKKPIQIGFLSQETDPFLRNALIVSCTFALSELSSYFRLKGWAGKKEVKMKLLFQLSGYSLFIGFRRRMTSAGTVTAGFKHELSEYESLGIKKTGSDRADPISGGQRSKICRKEANQLFELAQFAISEIRPGLRSVGGKNAERTEMLLYLRLLLRKYPALFADRAFPFRIAINNVIVGEMAECCSIHLDAKDLQTCWSRES